MDPPVETTLPQVDTPAELFKKATHRWEHGYHPSVETTEAIMKDLREVAFLIQNIQERRLELDNAMARILNRGKTCQVRFTAESLIREGDFIAQERDQIHDYGQKLLANEWIQSLLKNARK